MSVDWIHPIWALSADRICDAQTEPICARSAVAVNVLLWAVVPEIKWNDPDMRQTISP
jgi:hypothetical protein